MKMPLRLSQRNSCPIGFRRAVGLAFDVFCVFVIYYLPAHFLNHDSVFSLNSVAANRLAVFNNPLQQLLFSPLGLIFWRVICRFILRAQTPGEFLSGYSVACKQTGGDSFFWHVLYGFLQSFVVIAGAVLPMLVFCIVQVFLERFSSCSWYQLSEMLLLVPLLISIACMFSPFYQPRNNDGNEAGIDAICSMRVVFRAGRGS